MRVSSTRTIISGNGAVVSSGNGRRLGEYDKWRMSWNGNMFAPPPAAGCVLYLPGHPGVGSTITDFSYNEATGARYNNHGTVYGATWERLPGGLPCLDFDGGDDRVDCGDSASLSALSAWTFSCWFNQDIQGDEGLISKEDGVGGHREWMFGLTNLGLLCAYQFSAAPVNYLTATGTLDVSDTKWHFGVSTWDGVNDIGHMLLYADGVPDALSFEIKKLTGGVPHNTASPVEVGRYYASNTYCFDGKIILPRIYNRALSAAEVLNSYQQERSLFNV